LGFGLVPLRPPAPAAAAAPCRTGARRRASRQMKNAIPLSTAIAPIAIASAVPELRPLLPDEGAAVVRIWGAVVVVCC
jgi:hypothetical protein